MITANIPRTTYNTGSELDQTKSHRTTLLNQEQIAFKKEWKQEVGKLNMYQKATLLNDNAVGTVHENLESRFMEGDTTMCDDIKYTLYIHEELDLTGIYSYDTDKLIVLGAYKETRPLWVDLIQQ